MNRSLEQHQVEIERNKSFWAQKPLLRLIYEGFYREIAERIDRTIPGRIVELGSGIGNLQSVLPDALRTDLFENPWLDLVCDGYHLPFRAATVSHLVLFDVFHHLQRPAAFLASAERVLAPAGRIVIFEPFISAASLPAYGLFHHEPVAWRAPIDPAPEPPPADRYYAAQGNATRTFFRPGETLSPRWTVREKRVFASFTYLLSGGFSKPALFPAASLPMLTAMDRFLSRFPNLFGARCLVVLERTAGQGTNRAAI